MQEHYDAVKQTFDQVGPIWMNNLGRIASVDMAQVIQQDPGLLGLHNGAFSVSHRISYKSDSTDK
jgi:hypothetical protein